MPIPALAQGLFKGFDTLPGFYTFIRVLPWVALVVVLKFFLGGARNRAERLMHGKVVMVTVRCSHAILYDIVTVSRVAHRASELKLLEVLHHAALK